MEQLLALEMVRVTEAAAIAAARYMGRGDRMEADRLATEAMRTTMDEIDMEGTIVIGEGERDEAPMLYIGEQVGRPGSARDGDRALPAVDIAVDPLEGTNLVAMGQSNSITVLAASERGGLLHAPDTYFEKLCVGPVVAGKVDVPEKIIDFPPTELKRLSGLNLDLPEMRRVLTKLGFFVAGDAKKLKVAVPSWRPDVEGKADLVEEIVRIVGVEFSHGRQEDAPRPCELLRRRRHGAAVLILAQTHDAHALEQPRQIVAAGSCGVGHRFGGKQCAAKCVRRTHVRTRRAGTHGDTDAGFDEGHAAARLDLADLGKFVDAAGHHQHQIRGFAGLDAAQNLHSGHPLRDDLVAAGPLERGHHFDIGVLVRHRGNNGDFRRARHEPAACQCHGKQHPYNNPAGFHDDLPFAHVCAVYVNTTVCVTRP